MDDLKEKGWFRDDGRPMSVNLKTEVKRENSTTAKAETPNVVYLP